MYSGNIERRYSQRRGDRTKSALENADDGEAGERIVYRNLAGRGLLEERHDLEERIKRLKDKQEKTSAQLQRSDTRITDLEHRV
jgi:phage shock protein A